MPPKSKGSVKPTAIVQDPPPQTVHEQTLRRFYQTHPVTQRKESQGFKALSPAEQKTYAHSEAVYPITKQVIHLTGKAEREYWKTVGKEGLPFHRLSRTHDWGTDKSGRDIGTYSPEDLQQRNLKQAKLLALRLQSRQFTTKKHLTFQGVGKKEEVKQEEQDRQKDDKIDIRNNTDSPVPLPKKEIEAEQQRRVTMAALTKDLYGEFTSSLALNPEWDDVIPIPQNEPDGALAQIAYPEDYAECISYLRAVMAIDECSTRALRLTETVISMNPAHYTVWLYRFKILSHLKIPVPDEIAWLNEVSLANLKNYQIWNHRQLLLDHYYPEIASEPDTLKTLARSETAFIKIMLAEDTKNYHVWTYRKYIVEKLGLFNVQEMGATQNMIEEDVRNNSAWAHRFFLVFSNPKYSDADPNTTTSPSSKLPTPPTLPDPNIPAEVIEKEIRYAKEKIELAPQNQSGWNYLRGVATKGSVPLTDFEAFAKSFIKNLGQGDEEEQVMSSHALDLLAEAAKLKGDADTAKLCLQRLSEKWDPIRAGYWKFRMSEL